MDKFPLVSIIIPVYNGANYLEEAIKSALNQTYKNIEVLVINDGSFDENQTRNMALKYKEKIIYIEKENGGVATALNRGLKEMKGEYFSWLSHDDVYYPNKIEEQVKVIFQFNKPCLVWSNYDVINKYSQITIQFNPLDFKVLNNDLEYIISARIHGCSLLIPKSAFKKAGYFDETLKTTQDNQMWARILQEGYSLVHLNKSLIQSRHHEEQGSITQKEKLDKEKKSFYIWIKKLVENNPKYEKHVLEFIENRIIA